MARTSRHAHITHSETGTSVFDPVLTELAYRWFCPHDGWVLDPFAGGAVRGIVAALTGRHYFGVDLSKKQIEANRLQAKDIVGSSGPMPQYVVGDSRNIPKLRVGTEFDFLFTCPPYGDLERYSDDPADISNLDYPKFREAYFDIIEKSCARLKQDRFAAIVIGEIRDQKTGAYRGFLPDTVHAFQKAGLAYHNEAVLVMPVGNQRLRAGKSFETTRKLGKTHANFLVFLKGDARRAAKACGDVEFGDIEEGEAA